MHIKVAVIIIVPVVIAAYFITRKLLFAKQQLQEARRISAYRALFKFSRMLSNDAMPRAHNKRDEFLSLMRETYYCSIENKKDRFSSEINVILDKLDRTYYKMAGPNEKGEADQKWADNFMEHELYNLATRLSDLIRIELRDLSIIL